jgi:hypothetical protein
MEGGEHEGSGVICKTAKPPFSSPYRPMHAVVVQCKWLDPSWLDPLSSWTAPLLGLQEVKPIACPTPAATSPSRARRRLLAHQHTSRDQGSGAARGESAATREGGSEEVHCTKEPQ